MFKKKEEMDKFFKENKLSELFHENSKIFHFGPRIELLYEDVTKIHFKEYPRAKKIELSKNFEKNSSLEKILESRFSKRDFNQKAITINEISKILFYSGGIMRFEQRENIDTSRRSYPSAGARYPLEIYTIIVRSKEIEPGIYHYNVLSHSLEEIKRGKYIEEMMKLIHPEQKSFKDASLFIVITANFSRTQNKYDERGYRFILLEAGHLGQNICLITNSLGLGACPIGGFLDDNLDELLDLDKGESSIYLFAVG